MPASATCGAGTVEDGGDRVLDVGGLAFLDHQHGLLALAERKDFVIDQGIGDVEHVKRDLALAVGVSEPQPLQGADHPVVHAALQDDAELAVPAETLVEAALLNEAPGRGHALGHLLDLVTVGVGRQRNAVRPSLRVFQRLAHGERRRPIVLRLEGAVDVAGADPDLQDHRRMGGLGQLEAVAYRLHDGGQVRARVQQPELGLGGEGMSALLHDRGAFAVILAENHHRAAGHAARGEIGERIRRHVGADGPLEGDRAPDRIVDRGGEHGGGRSLAGVGLEMHAELVQDLLGVGEHVDQVRNRRARIAADIADAAFEQGLRNRQNSLAAKFLPRADAQILNFLCE